MKPILFLTFLITLIIFTIPVYAIWNMTIESKTVITQIHSVSYGSINNNGFICGFKYSNITWINLGVTITKPIPYCLLSNQLIFFVIYKVQNFTEIKQDTQIVTLGTLKLIISKIDNYTLRIVLINSTTGIKLLERYFKYYRFIIFPDGSIVKVEVPIKAFTVVPYEVENGNYKFLLFLNVLENVTYIHFPPSVETDSKFIKCRATKYLEIETSLIRVVSQSFCLKFPSNEYRHYFIWRGTFENSLRYVIVNSSIYKQLIKIPIRVEYFKCVDNCVNLTVVIRLDNSTNSSLSFIGNAYRTRYYYDTSILKYPVVTMLINLSRYGYSRINICDPLEVTILKNGSYYASKAVDTPYCIPVTYIRIPNEKLYMSNLVLLVLNFYEIVRNVPIFEIKEIKHDVVAYPSSLIKFEMYIANIGNASGSVNILIKDYTGTTCNSTTITLNVDEVKYIELTCRAPFEEGNYTYRIELLNVMTQQIDDSYITTIKVAYPRFRILNATTVAYAKKSFDFTFFVNLTNLGFDGVAHIVAKDHNLNVCNETWIEIPFNVSKIVYLTCKAPNAVGNFTYHIFVLNDYRGTIDDYRNFTVVVSSYPVFKIVNVTPSYVLVDSGESFTISVTVKNVGDWAGEFKIIIENETGKVSESGTYYLHVQESKTIEVRVKGPILKPRHEPYFTYYVKVLNLEINQVDDVKTVTVRVKIYIPVFTFEKVEAPDEVQENTWFLIKGVVKNIGNGTGRFRVFVQPPLKYISCTTFENELTPGGSMKFEVNCTSPVGKGTFIYRVNIYNFYTDKIDDSVDISIRVTEKFRLTLSAAVIAGIVIFIIIIIIAVVLGMKKGKVGGGKK